MQQETRAVLFFSFQFPVFLPRCGQDKATHRERERANQNETEQRNVPSQLPMARSIRGIHVREMENIGVRRARNPQFDLRPLNRYVPALLFVLMSTLSIQRSTKLSLALLEDRFTFAQCGALIILSSPTAIELQDHYIL